MSGTAANVRSWNGASVRVADVGSTAPTTITGSWDAAFADIGLISEDEGLAFARELDVKKVRAYGGGVVRAIKSKFGFSFKFTMLESSLAVAQLTWPGSTWATASGVTTGTLKTATVADPRAWGVDLTDGSIGQRFVFTKGEVTEVSEFSVKDTDETAFEVSVEVYADGSNVIGKLITNDSAMAVA